VWHRHSSTAAVFVSAEFVMCGTDRAALQMFVLVLSLLCVAQTEQHCSFGISAEFVMCGTNRAAL
jgi:hypothetical protein